MKDYWVGIFSLMSGLTGYMVYVELYGWATYGGLIAIGFALDQTKGKEADNGR